MEQNDDFAFIREHLTSEAATRAQPVPLPGTRAGTVPGAGRGNRRAARGVAAAEVQLRRADVAVDRLRVDGTLELAHDHATDGRGLDHERSAKVLDYLVKIWRRPIVLTSIDGEGRALQLTANPA